MTPCYTATWDLVLVVLLVLDVAVPDYDISPGILLPLMGAIVALLGLGETLGQNLDPAAEETQVAFDLALKHRRAGEARFELSGRDRPPVHVPDPPRVPTDMVA